MSNCYDIEIKMNYFDWGDDYEDMLEKKKEFFDEAKDIMNYFKRISKSEKAYLKEWDIMYGEEAVKTMKYLNDPMKKGMEGENYE
jgi:hypothetical protein